MFGPHADPSIRMTIRLEGLSAAQIAAIDHAAKELALTKTPSTDKSGTEPAKGSPFVNVTKSEMKGENGTYTVLLTVLTKLVGFTPSQVAHREPQFICVTPGRAGLDSIFDAAGILPASEMYEKHPKAP